MVKEIENVWRYTMKKILFYSMLFFLLFSGITPAQEDYPGSKDHPIISRYPGSQIVHYSQKQFDEYYLLTGSIKSSSDKDIQNARKIRLEGKVTKITYEAPKDRSNFEVYKNYEQALEKAGFKILYKGKGNEIRGVPSFLHKMNREYTGSWSDPDIYPWFYLSAKSLDDKYFISLYVHGSKPVVVLAVVEPEQMQTGLITAKMMERQISETGRVSIYGIYFDFDSAEIKPESKPTLDEIAKLLKESPKLKLYGVGHTDNVGGLEYNINLSKRRAMNVVKELVEKYGIEKSRLTPFGVGPLSPVASNRTEEGRAKNRRVELVEQ